MRDQMRRDRLKARRQRGEPSATPEVQVFFPAGPPPVRRIFESPADDAAARVTTSADSAGASASARGPGSGEGHDAGKSHDDDVPAAPSSPTPLPAPRYDVPARLRGPQSPSAMPSPLLPAGSRTVAMLAGGADGPTQSAAPGVSPASRAVPTEASAAALAPTDPSLYDSDLVARRWLGDLVDAAASGFLPQSEGKAGEGEVAATTVAEPPANSGGPAPASEGKHDADVATAALIDAAAAAAVAAHRSSVEGNAAGAAGVPPPRVPALPLHNMLGRSNGLGTTVASVATEADLEHHTELLAVTSTSPIAAPTAIPSPPPGEHGSDGMPSPPPLGAADAPDIDEDVGVALEPPPSSDDSSVASSGSDDDARSSSSSDDRLSTSISPPTMPAAVDMQLSADVEDAVSGAYRPPASDASDSASGVREAADHEALLASLQRLQDGVLSDDEDFGDDEPPTHGQDRPSSSATDDDEVNTAGVSAMLHALVAAHADLVAAPADESVLGVESSVEASAIGSTPSPSPPPASRNAVNAAAATQQPALAAGAPCVDAQPAEAPRAVSLQPAPTSRASAVRSRGASSEPSVVPGGHDTGGQPGLRGASPPVDHPPTPSPTARRAAIAARGDAGAEGSVPEREPKRLDLKAIVAGDGGSHHLADAVRG